MSHDRSVYPPTCAVHSTVGAASPHRLILDNVALSEGIFICHFGWNQPALRLKVGNGNHLFYASTRQDVPLHQRHPRKVNWRNDCVPNPNLDSTSPFQRLKYPTNLLASDFGSTHHDRSVSTEGFIWFRHPPCGCIPALENRFSQVEYNGNSI